MEDTDDEYEFAFGVQNQTPFTSSQHVSTKIPPSYDTTQSWFAYEEAVEEWLDITELPEEKRGPALRAQLKGPAKEYKHHLETEKLKQGGTMTPEMAQNAIQKAMTESPKFKMTYNEIPVFTIAQSKWKYTELD